ncbi:MAG: S41 family peptidase [Allosphingosinicella sp.]
MRLLPMLLLLAAAAPAAEPSADDYRADARAIAPLIQDTYAYLDRFPGGVAPSSQKLKAEAEQVHDRRSLLIYAERALLALADHHAITGASTAHDWAIVPSYADLWIERRGGSYVIETVRDASPAAAAGIARGDRLIAVGGVPTGEAVEAFWDDLGLPVTDERAGFAARILAAGRRDSPRRLAVQRGRAAPHRVELPNLYQLPRPPRPPVATRREGAALVLRFNDSLGDDGTIAAFDAAMAAVRTRQPVVIDLTDTPSGGNTVVARAVLGWFVTRATGYQVHNLPAEERRTGIPRQWIEQVLPRAGKRHAAPVMVLVGRWTGSMGEGVAIGFSALGAPVVGDPMAGLRGAVYDERLEHSGLVLKLPAERLYTVAGVPRERFAPIPARSRPSRRSRPANP